MLSETNPSVPSNGDAASRTRSSSKTSPAHASNGVNGSSNGVKGPSAKPSPPETYFGHSGEEVTRILIQALSDMGYQDAAKSVSRDSGYELEIPPVAAFRAAVLGGRWDEAEDLLDEATWPNEDADKRNGLVLAEGSDPDLMRFWIKQQKYLELLEKRDPGRALAVLRSELTPLGNDPSRLKFLSGLLMSVSPNDMKVKAKWDGAAGKSRKNLLSELSKCVSPSVMLPENRLAVLLQTVKQGQIDTCLHHTAASSPSLYYDHSCPRQRFPTDVGLELDNCDGEVWNVIFSPDGSMLAACGSRKVVIWGSKFEKILELEYHVGGVGDISWSPDSKMLVSCGQDRNARVWSIPDGKCLHRTKTYDEPVSSCVWASDSRSFVLGTLDAQEGLNTYQVETWEVQNWDKGHRVQDVCGSPDGRWLVAVDDTSKMHVYNGITRELEYQLEYKTRPTSVCISEDSRHMLVNKVDGEAQLVDLETRATAQKFLGHTGGDYVIRCSFGGANESFVLSGSEDGNVLIWHKTIGAAVERLQGHRPRCNAVSWKPDDPSMLASCGDDGKVKIWMDKTRAKQAREGAKSGHTGSGHMGFSNY